MKTTSLAVALALLSIAAHAQEAPRIPTEAEKIEALKLGYILNDNSMVRWGSIDLTGPVPIPQEERVVPLKKPATQKGSSK